jgi:hypothetical protein
VPQSDLAAKLLTLERHHVWDDDNFCLPEYRSNGIARQLSLFSDRYMAGLGDTVALARVSTSNIAALRMQRHKGSDLRCHVSCRRVLFYKRLRVSPEHPAAGPGVTSSYRYSATSAVKPRQCLAEAETRDHTLGARPVRRYGCSQRWLGTSFETRRRSQKRIRT